MSEALYDYFDRMAIRAAQLSTVVRALLAFAVVGLRFRRIGRLCKLRGGRRHIRIGRGVSLGDFCWIEALRGYKGQQFSPKLVLEDEVAISDLTHISCAESITIGAGTLIGSKVYIGDHHHGSVACWSQDASVPPAGRPLGDFGAVVIGCNCWIGDGAVLLPSTHIAPNSIVAANSVVKLSVDRPALIAGCPAKVIRFF